ncbi:MULTISPECIES: diguanylate cyclase [Pseudomonas]|uniref:Diguanylate cyclase (GGDEF)-like protein n=1 Tax=Phytopseudomonas flavescens TaxID=29435 RepID=A0A7Y9XN55_9GAMM|nr:MULTISPECIES: diguanylate cyclase [Pseudomonas]MCW2291032.1 diguanylate cyclase (GGDEF)-like protein [Pseudomonas sp. BIGb0408]NYH74397.1 diguanylate cyclase (GGDEF)-like protein [Pseudomonas flavescens]
MRTSRHIRTQERRIILALLAALLAVQVIIYLVSVRTNRNIVEETINTSLETTAQVVDQLLELRHRQLGQGAAVLAADYGLKEAIAIGERATIESMLQNHGRRLQADIAVLNSLDRQLIASVPSELQQADIVPLLKAAAQSGGTDGQLPITLLRSQSGVLYQLIHSVVSMPTPQAELTLGFAIDDDLAEDLKRVTDTEFVILSRGENGAWQLHGDTLNSTFDRLLGNPAALIDGASWTLQDADNEYLMRSVSLSNVNAQGASEVLLIMGKSLGQTMAAYARIETFQRYLLLASLLLSALVVLLISRHLLRPLNTLAHLDPLTDLPNRRLFDHSVANALTSKGRSTPFALMMIDLDHFKQINDRYGHAAGDEVLKVSARRLRGLLRRIDMPARLGGDEFAALLPGLDRAAAIRLGQRIEEALSEPITFNQQTLQIGISIGIAIAPEDGQTASDLLRMADAEMYADKAQRENESV